MVTVASGGAGAVGDGGGAKGVAGFVFTNSNGGHLTNCVEDNHHHLLAEGIGSDIRGLTSYIGVCHATC